MYKVVGLIVVLVVGYLLFFKDSSPEVIYFNNQEYGPKRLDRSNDSNSSIYKYYSKQVSNKDYISILHPDSGTGSLSDWSEMFSKHFERQGFKFKGSVNKVGVKNAVKVFMMPSQRYNVVIMYILENTKNSSHIDESVIFDNLDHMVLE